MADHLQFGKYVAEGTAYEVGKECARQLRKNARLQKSGVCPKEQEIRGESLRNRQKLLEEVCPGILEEIQGVCDELKIPLGRMMVFQDFAMTPAEGGQCSQVAALPSITADGSLLVGRSYEYDLTDELCLCVTRAENKPAHAGFSLFLFGRTDGMNDRGLCVTMSSCAYMQRPSGTGVLFPMVIRALLDRCATVEDAVYLLKQIPICSNDNILVADAKGNAKIAEICSFGRTKRISFREGEEFLAATNHYQNPDMLEFDNHRGRHSVRRWRTACETLSRYRGEATEEVMKTLLEKRMPEGLACPYYYDGLGTLRSMFFNVTAGKLQVCYGMPERENWSAVALDAPCENIIFDVAVENEFAENPKEFWKTLPPGDLDQ